MLDQTESWGNSKRVITAALLTFHTLGDILLHFFNENVASFVCFVCLHAASPPHPFVCVCVEAAVSGHPVLPLQQGTAATLHSARWYF